MAEKSRLWDTNGTGDGATTVTEAQWAEVWRAVANNGVIAGHLNALAATTATNTVTVASGAASVDGFVYVNDAPVSVTIPSSAAGTTRIDRIVLRASWAAQTVRITRIAGTDSGTPTPPAMTLNSGTTYDVPLYSLIVNQSGAITYVEDERRPTLGTTGLVYQRQGGNATEWTVAGGINFATVGNVREQVGAIQWTGSAATNGFVDVALPSTFAGIPIALANASGAAGGDIIISNVTPLTGSTLRITWRSWNNTAYTGVAFHWRAIGVI